MAASASADATWLPSPLLGGYASDQSITAVAATAIAALILVPVIASYLFGAGDSGIPLANAPKPFELRSQKKLQFVQDGMRLWNDARNRFRNKPFSLLTQLGHVVILPADRALDVKNTPAFNFRTQFAELIPFNLPGFGPFKMLAHPGEILQKVVKKHLTKRLNTVTEPLAYEATIAMDKVFGKPRDWTEVNTYSSLLLVVARLSSRVFLGTSACRDEEWLEITTTYTKHQMAAFVKLGLFPRWMRPLVYILDPGCTILRKERARATKIVEAEVGRRRDERRKAAAEGVPAPYYNDAIAWAELEAEGVSYNVTDFQLSLSFAAIHTTTDLVTQTMNCLVADQDAIKSLRQEIVEVLREGGWKKTSLYKMKLLDSAIKEAQRLKPSSLEATKRKATADVELPGGLKIRKGQLISVDSSAGLWNAERYENPKKFDIHRFRNMRETEGGEHKAQLVSTVPEHLTFGLGKYACPGRFFAANEVKIALCHLLIKYDWELGPGATLEPVWVGTSLLTNMDNKMRYRTRVPEIDLDSLEVEIEE